MRPATLKDFPVRGADSVAKGGDFVYIGGCTGGLQTRNGMKRYLAEARMGGSSQNNTLFTPGGSDERTSTGMGHPSQVQQGQSKVNVGEGPDLRRGAGTAGRRFLEGLELPEGSRRALRGYLDLLDLLILRLRQIPVYAQKFRKATLDRPECFRDRVRETHRNRRHVGAFHAPITG